MCWPIGQLDGACLLSGFARDDDQLGAQQSSAGRKADLDVLYRVRLGTVGRLWEALAHMRIVCIDIRSVEHQDVRGSASSAFIFVFEGHRGSVWRFRRGFVGEGSCVGLLAGLYKIAGQNRSVNIMRMNQ